MTVLVTWWTMARWFVVGVAASVAVPHDLPRAFAFGLVLNTALSLGEMSRRKPPR